MTVTRLFVLAAALVACGSSGGRASPAPAALTDVRRIVETIRRDDYRGDLAGLARGHAALAAFQRDPAVRYWRGYALWRSGMNRVNVVGFSRAAAAREFRDAEATFATITSGPFALEAEIAATGCWMGLAFVADSSEARREAIRRARALAANTSARAPENPRALWMLGGQQLYMPSGSGDDKARAVPTFERGLALARATPAPRDPLTPSWGEAELLMSLAFARSMFEPRDLDRAEMYARAALALEPEWSLIRDLVLPRILAARGR